MRTLVLVSGAPGAGKSTLARPLAGHLGLPLLTKDTIKEQLHDSLGPLDADPFVSSRRFGGAAMDLLWRLASCCPAVVLEANFRPGSAYERARIAELCPAPVEVHCHCPPEEAARRYAERARRPGHHAVHPQHTIGPALQAEYPGPVGLGEVIVVDTTHPVDAAAVAGLVRAALAGP
jgi:predicted kinase